MSVKQRLYRVVFGRPEQIVRRVVLGLMLVSVSVAAVGVYLLAVENVQPQTSSLPYLRPVFQYGVSTWIVPVLIVIVTWRLLLFRRRRIAQIAADVVGYTTTTVERLAAEARTPDGSTRAILTSDDDIDTIAALVRAKLYDGDDDVPTPVDDAAAEDATPTGDPGDTGVDDAEIEWTEELKAVRLDLASTLDFSEILWHGVVPGVVAAAGLLLAVQIWVALWVYPVIAAAGVLVGLLNLGRRHVTLHRRLERTRHDREVDPWDDLSVRVQRVETPETTMHYAWLAGKRYAHPDEDEFVAGVARRAYEHLHGVPVSPWIAEKYHRQLINYKPNLGAFRDTEKRDVMAHLMRDVRTAPEGIVPLQLLIEDAVEHDRDDGDGVRGRVSVTTSLGYDPALVREAFRDMVPGAFVTEDIETTRGTVTAVRMTDDPLPRRFVERQADFSDKFGYAAEWDGLYEPPEVDDLLEHEPEDIITPSATTFGE